MHRKKCVCVCVCVCRYIILILNTQSHFLKVRLGLTQDPKKWTINQIKMNHIHAICVFERKTHIGTNEGRQVHPFKVLSIAFGMFVGIVKIYLRYLGDINNGRMWCPAEVFLCPAF